MIGLDSIFVIVCSLFEYFLEIIPCKEIFPSHKTVKKEGRRFLDGEGLVSHFPSVRNIMGNGWWQQI